MEHILPSHSSIYGHLACFRLLWLLLPWAWVTSLNAFWVRWWYLSRSVTGMPQLYCASLCCIFQMLQIYKLKFLEVLHGARPPVPLFRQYLVTLVTPCHTLVILNIFNFFNIIIFVMVICDLWHHNCLFFDLKYVHCCLELILLHI